MRLRHPASRVPSGLHPQGGLVPAPGDPSQRPAVRPEDPLLAVMAGLPAHGACGVTAHGSILFMLVMVRLLLGGSPGAGINPCEKSDTVRPHSAALQQGAGSGPPIRSALTLTHCCVHAQLVREISFSSRVCVDL